MPTAGMRLVDQGQDTPRRRWDRRTRPKHCLDTDLLEHGVVACRNDPADGDHNVVGAEAFEFLDELWYQGLVSAGLRRDADHVHVVLDGLAGNLFGSLKQRADIDI